MASADAGPIGQDRSVEHRPSTHRGVATNGTSPHHRASAHRGPGEQNTALDDGTGTYDRAGTHACAS